MNKIILTGASGLLGRAITPALSPGYRLVRLGLRRAGKGIKGSIHVGPNIENYHPFV